MSKIAKQEAAELVGTARIDGTTTQLPLGTVEAEMKVDKTDNDLPLRLEIVGWMNRDDIISLRRVLKAVLETLP